LKKNIKRSMDFEKNKEIHVHQKCMSLKLLACRLCDFKHCVFVIYDVTIHVCDFVIRSLIYYIKIIENSDANNGIQIIMHNNLDIRCKVP
jgi:hypothetical protein